MREKKGFDDTVKRVRKRSHRLCCVCHLALREIVELKAKQRRHGVGGGWWGGGWACLVE